MTDDAHDDERGSATDAETSTDEARAPNAGPDDDQAIVAYLQTAGNVVPDTLRDAVYGADDKDPPSLVIESAEGITTFGGFNGHAGTAKAKGWLADQLKVIADRYRPHKPTDT